MRLAPYCDGRVYWLDHGINWWEPGCAPRPGWYWWNAEGQAMEEALEGEITDRPLKTLIYHSDESWRLAEGFRAGQLLKAWSAGGFLWTVSQVNGPSPARPERSIRGQPTCLAEAVRRGGGQLLRATRVGSYWQVDWASQQGRYCSQLDAQLNVINAGLCLNGQDRIQDLTSLVSLVLREEQDGGNFGRGGW